MDISTLRKQLGTLINDLPPEGVQITKHGRVVARLLPPIAQTLVSIEDVRQKAENFRQATGNPFDQLRTSREFAIEDAKRKDKARRELLSRINKKS